ncbi:uncharacterized protein LOC131658165 [Vicia villosa]|uniref:uncharacterized protein LOC131658165 n=1 Tax=Vicia villosa TaxID=3911 RepID=UPI00273C056A|nr:uncharacterized protein LOC131658165 [Vicia villosa]
MQTHSVTRFRDWRISGNLNSVRNQGEGESCFAFASCAAVEFLYHRHPNFEQRVLLSPQDLWNNLVDVNLLMGADDDEDDSDGADDDEDGSNDDEDDSDGADDDEDGSDDDEGGCSIPLALEWIRDHGCVLEEDSPYLEVLQHPLPLNERLVKMRIETVVPVLSKNMEYDVFHYGPVIVSIDWIREMDRISGDEIYQGPRHASAFDPTLVTHHAVLVIGFGARRVENELVQFWIIQNSYGPEWGHNGCAKFTRAKIHNRYLINDGWRPAGVTNLDGNGIEYEV